MEKLNDLENAARLAGKFLRDDINRITTYNERSQHRTLKFLLEADPAFHEIHVRSYVADICKEGKIYEIQTAGFAALSSKLEDFLRDHSVTVVYPAPVIKTVMWTDPETGIITPGRRFPMRASKYKLLSELIHIHGFLVRSNFSVLLIETEVNDYRLLDGRGAERKIKATKADTVPVNIVSTTEIRNSVDILQILPLDFGVAYSRADIEKCFQLKGRNLSNAIKFLVLSGVLEKLNGEGRKVYYKLAEAADESV